MTIFRHEWRRGRLGLAVWTAALAAFLFICMIMFPEMKSEMEDVSRIFAAMGAFTAAFGMDRLNFGEAMGFYGVECGNIIGIGGALFAALLGIAALAAEEKNHTAEFLLSHPVSRTSVIAQKLLAVLTQILAMNGILTLIAAGSFFLIGEKLKVQEFLLLHLACTMLQTEIAAVCFAASAFLKRGGFGVGIGLAMLFYFLGLMANISDSVKFLRYFTPFGYAQPSEILVERELDPVLLVIGCAVTLVCIALAFWQYRRKDISA